MWDMGLPWQKSSPGAALLICQDIRQRSNNNKNRNRQPAGRQGQKKKKMSKDNTACLLSVEESRDHLELRIL